jgi:ankyrin repeat protein
MSDNLNSDKNNRARKKPVPTLADQHWRIFLRDKTGDELEEDMLDAIKTGNEWRFEILMQLDVNLSSPGNLMEAAIENNRTAMLVRIAEKSDGWQDHYTKNRLAEKAVEAGRLDVLYALVENYGADVHQYNENLLRRASEKGHLRIVRYLLSKGAEADVWNNAPLRGACENGHLEVVKCLVAAGADVDGQDGAALADAAANNHLDVVAYLLQNGADVSKNNYRALCRAAGESAVDTLKLLLTKVDAAGLRTCDALGDAVGGEKFIAAKILLDAGADIDAKDGEILRRACWQGEEKAVRFLLQNGANPNVHKNRETPLSEAVNAGHINIVVLLAEAGADPGYLQNEAVSEARRREKPEMIDAMLEGAKVALQKRSVEKMQEFKAAFKGVYSLDDLRLRQGASGETGLMLAAQSGHFEDIVRAARGGENPRLAAADLYHPDDRVDTVLSLLIRHDALQQFFAPDFWVSRQRELAETLKQLPESLQKQVDFGPISSEINRQELIKKAQGKNFKPPRL